MDNSKIKLSAYIYIHFSLLLVEKLSRRSHLLANKEFTHCVFKQRNGIDDMTFTMFNHIGESRVFMMSSLDHVMSRDTMLFLELHFSSIDLFRLCIRNVNIKVYILSILHEIMFCGFFIYMRI